MTQLATDVTSPTLRSDFDTTFAWDYTLTRRGMDTLYEKAKADQWNAPTDVEWSIEVHAERDVHRQAQSPDVQVGFQTPQEPSCR